MCKCDKSKEKEKHIISFNCPVYADIRANYQDFNEDQDLVAYFNQVLESRDRIDSMEQDGAGRRISMPRRGGLRPPPYLYIQDWAASNSKGLDRAVLYVYNLASYATKFV